MGIVHITASVVGAAALLAGLALAVQRGEAPARAVPAPQEGQDVMRSVAPSIFVVKHFDREGDFQALGSAVEIRGGYLVTSGHVVTGMGTLLLEQDGRSWPATLRDCDPGHDLCLLSAAGLDAPGVPLRLASPAEAGEAVYAVGAPEGLDLVISEGLVSGLRKIGQEPELVITAPVSEGSSGGGVFDRKARLLGLTQAQVMNGQDLNVAAPAAWIAELIDRQMLWTQRNAGHPAPIQSVCVAGLGTADDAGLAKELLVDTLFQSGVETTETCAHADAEIGGQIDTGIADDPAYAQAGGVVRLVLHLADRDGTVRWAGVESDRARAGESGEQRVARRAVDELLKAGLVAVHAAPGR